ncbi:hypothetical protein [Mycobacterium haemophilum]|uniref:Uncharacterized protein n=1 Tax=Mycobacterium haemophilum TaxID=29311 RepID=A0A0I9UPG5_9MYCO|nr:hypothetical protein [Mycobacterium haemophilum]KLO28403.1 hypothetical protein ABH39_14105 [Mycobacterium haemophilum]KLO37444.1 hypothetical protein ABH38_08565 [Mycobacterium haemophilum]KLO43993.1 hypothetical protein ABH37_06090 [Mycobacterium haemophilum]KLO49273.1 hypothetical protein ABH36_12955 [Mycobacterium haemophilum]
MAIVGRFRPRNAHEMPFLAAITGDGVRLDTPLGPAPVAARFALRGEWTGRELSPQIVTGMCSHGYRLLLRRELRSADHVRENTPTTVATPSGSRRRRFRTRTRGSIVHDVRHGEKIR